MRMQFVICFTVTRALSSSWEQIKVNIGSRQSQAPRVTEAWTAATTAPLQHSAVRRRRQRHHRGLLACVSRSPIRLTPQRTEPLCPMKICRPYVTSLMADSAWQPHRPSLCLPRFEGRTMQDRRGFMRQCETYLTVVNAI